MPKAWQPYIKEGIEAWNEAFEKIGFRNVVRVMDFPKDDPDFNANNIKYSTTGMPRCGLICRIRCTWTLVRERY